MKSLGFVSLVGAGLSTIVEDSMTNTDASTDHFMMDPRQQFRVVKALRVASLGISAIHHSHPASPARPRTRTSGSPTLRGSSPRFSLWPSRARPA